MTHKQVRDYLLRHFRPNIHHWNGCGRNRTRTPFGRPSAAAAIHRLSRTLQLESMENDVYISSHDGIHIAVKISAKSSWVNGSTKTRNVCATFMNHCRRIRTCFNGTIPLQHTSYV